MKAIWKGAISFGLVTIPVAVMSASEEKTVRFHQVHAKDNGRIRMKRTCSECGEEVPFDQLAMVAAQLPSLQQQLLRVIGQSVGRDQDHLGILVRRQAGERIALFLHGLSERYRNIGQSGSQFKLPMSREDIAHYLGLALETVSRGFTKLQEDGVIEVVGRRIDIRDAAELARLAHNAEHEEPRRRGRA